MKTIKTGRYAITIKELTYWNDEEIKSQMAEGVKMKGADLSGIAGSAMLKAKERTIELSVVEIKEEEKVVLYSIEWLKGLTKEEGTDLYSAIDGLSKKK